MKTLKKITLCSKSKSLIVLKFLSDESLRFIPLTSAPRAPESNFIFITHPIKKKLFCH